MKKNLFSLGLIAVAAFTLTNCTQEIANPNEQPETAGYPFEVVASTVDTKTVNDGMATKWDSNDQINLFHAITGGTDYKDNGAFDVKDAEEGTFNGNLCETLDEEKKYDWYALYPYNDKITTPAKQTEGFTYIGHTKGLNQTGYNSMASLKETVCPLYGVLKSCPAGDKPVFEMQHLSSVVAINVTNANEEPLTVTTASLTAEEDIVGSYYFDLTTTPVTYTPSGNDYVYKTATVNVTSGATALAQGESAVLYLAIKPFTAANGSKLVLSVNGYETELTMTKDVTFSAGKIKTLNFKYDYVAPVGEQSVTFDFTSSSEMKALNVTLPDSGKGTTITTLSKDDVTFVATGGSTATRLWNTSGKYDLRAYKGATLTFSVPTGYVISDIIVEGTATTGISKPTIPNNPVVLTVVSNADTQKISSVTVKYVEGEVEAVPLTMGSVTCVNQTSTSLTFSWDAVTGAEGYKVSLDAGNTWGDQFDVTNYTWEDLDPETDYTIYVKAVGNGINILDSEAVSSDATTEAEQAGVVTMSKVFTFTGSNGQTDFTVTQLPIKIKFAKDSGSNAPNDHSDKHIRIYTGNTMTFTGGTIVKIELKYSENNYPGTGTTANVGTLSQDTNSKIWTWVGKATTVILTGGSKQGRYDSIIVYYESDGTLPDPVKLEMGAVTCSAQTANTLTFKWDAVDGATGYEVSFNGGDAETFNATTYTAEGLTAETTYSISVKAVGDGTYYLTSDAKTATGTTSAEQSGGEPAWTLVTDASTLKAGDQVIIVANDYPYAMSTTQNNNNRGSVAVTKSTDKNNLTYTSAVQVMTLENGTKTSTFAFNVGSSNYLYAASSSNNYLKTGTKNDNASWKITISNGIATIVSQGTNTRNTMQYNTSNKLFACYGSASQEDLVIYRYE